MRWDRGFIEAQRRAYENSPVVAEVQAEKNRRESEMAASAGLSEEYQAYRKIVAEREDLISHHR